MPCYHPLPAWRGPLGESGKRAIVFKPPTDTVYSPVEVPCGTCIGCKLEFARRWAMRCYHESKMHEDNSFVTLTYSDDKLPPGGSLRPADFVLFMKRLRKMFGDGIKFFQCGEYGDKLGRPHHHALLFGVFFGDRRFHSESNGERLYTSQTLDNLWTHGFCSIGDVNFDSAGYVARYTLKKIRGDKAAAAHYGDKIPEYLTMSRRPGIGKAYLDKYWGDVFPHGNVVINGKEVSPPRYYLDVLAKRDPDLYREIRKRVAAECSNDVDRTGKRLLVREVVKTAAVKFLSRSFENDP